MTPERWRQIRSIFDDMVECDPAERDGLLCERCGNDGELQREVESLLASDRGAGPFLDSPILLSPFAVRRRQIDDLCRSARECSPAARAALLGKLDPELRQEVESLLQQNGLLGPKDGAAIAELLENSTGTVLAIGTRLGQYVIERLLVAGGMGRVYQAFDAGLDRKVAIKVPFERFSDRFERESHAIGRLKHPHICTVYGAWPNYLVMELLEGETLASRLRRERLPLEQALSFGAEVADALAYAHGRGIIHRDIKPSNIMITPDGVKVLDFGLAKMASSGGEPLTGSSTGMGGTPGYMAPEQQEGAPCDARTDIYALGLVLHEMLTGERASGPASQASPIAPRALDRVVRKCLAQNPGGRWQTAAELRDELKGSRTRLTRRRWMTAGFTLSVGAGVAAGGWVAWRMLPSALFPSKRTYVFRGHVHNERGDPVAEAAISANGASAISKPDGTFALTLASNPGRTITLAISRPGYHPRHIDNADFQVPDFGIILERDR
jgi:hypothetical protein